MNLSAPWVRDYRKLYHLFKYDEDITVRFDDDDTSPEVKMYVHSDKKVEALKKLLPESITYGNVTMKITVVPANKNVKSTRELFKDLFEGNQIVERIIDGDLFTYVQFEKKVIQYFNDNMADPKGNISTLYEIIAEDLFEGRHDGVFFCTAEGIKQKRPDIRYATINKIKF